jgi:prepilin-type N-terminal cleavage/methylation domain-containing protein
MIAAPRLRSQQGMTLVELLIAMVVIAIGVAGLVAGLGGGILAAERASTASTAGALADKQMEAYRSITFASIATDTTTTGAADATYTGDSAYNATWKITATCPGSQITAPYYYCNPSRTVAISGVSYRIDSYVAWTCGITGTTLVAAVAPSTIPTCTGSPASRAVKQVTIVVRDAANTSKTFVRVTSTFDALTG